MLFMLLIVPLTIKERKANKIKKEPLYYKLLRLCNPSIYMKDYDKAKVETANVLYQKLLNTSSADVEAINEIQAEAVSKLGITLIDKEQLEDLRKKVHPKNFTKPYNAEKVALASELYSILQKENLTYNEFIDVIEQSKKL